MMALRVLNQITSVKLPKPGSIRSISASPRTSPLQRSWRRDQVAQPRCKLFTIKRRSLSVPPKYPIRNYKSYFEEKAIDEEAEETEEPEMDRLSKLPVVLHYSHLPIRYEQFSPKRFDQIENVTKLAEECFNKFNKTKTQSNNEYILKDSRRAPSHEAIESFTRRHKHNDFISGCHLQPKNLCPFDGVDNIAEESVAVPIPQPRITYSFSDKKKSKLFEKNDKNLMRRNFSSKNCEIIVEPKKECVESKDKTISFKIDGQLDNIEQEESKQSKVPFKSYSDHLKAKLGQPNIVKVNQKRKFSMQPTAGSQPYSLPTSARNNNEPINLPTPPYAVLKKSPAFAHSPSHKLHLRKSAWNPKKNYIYNPNIDPYSILDEKRNVRHKIYPKIQMDGLNIPEQPNMNGLAIETNSNPEISGIFKHVDPSPSTSTLEPVTTQTITTPTARMLSIKHTSSKKVASRVQAGNVAPSLTYLLYNKIMSGPLTIQISDRQYGTCRDPCRDNRIKKCLIESSKEEVCVPRKKYPEQSRVPKHILEENEANLFDGLCEPPSKLYEPNKPCPCIERHLPHCLPKLKRLQKKNPTIDEVKQQTPECLPYVCPPRADDGLEDKKKSLPRLPCSDCPCIEPPPLDECTPLPRLVKKPNIPDEPRPPCAINTCPSRADDFLCSKKKSLRPLCKQPMDCKCFEPFLPSVLPKLHRLEKKHIVDASPCSDLCCPPPCQARADDKLNLYEKKNLPQLKYSDCPCLEPRPLDDCAPLPRLKKRPVYPDDKECKTEPCPLKSDDVCGYEVPKRKLKSLLPCQKPIGVQVSSSCEKGSNDQCKPNCCDPAEMAEIPSVKCPPQNPCTPACAPRPRCPTTKQGLLDELICKIVNYFKARPNCPAPDAWKKQHLRDIAEKAAKAAGLELCEPKCKIPPKDHCSEKRSVRHYSSSSGTWNNDSSFYFTQDTKLANEMELKQLIYRILKLLRIDDKENTNETSDQLLKEFMDLSEEEFDYINNIISTAHESLLYSNNLNASSKQKKFEVELENKMIETLDLFCKKANYLRNITYLEYEELEKLKTLTMQKKLDEMLMKYQVKAEHC